MAISSPGIGSNLDVNSIVSQLMALERQPITTLNMQEAKLQAKISAFGSVKGALSAFQTSVAALAAPAKFSAVKASVADTAVVSASATSSAAAGSYELEVKALASAQKLKSSAFTATTSEVGTGTFTIQFGTYDADGNSFTLNPDRSAVTVTIDGAKNTLAGVRDAINAVNGGVTASIVNDGTGNRLVLASTSTGIANSLKVTVAGDGDGNNTDTLGLSQLAYDPTAVAGSGKNLTETAAAANATVVVDGITITKSSNTISDALEGVTLNLLKSNTGSKTTLTVAKDTAGIRASIESFVKAYNDLDQTLTSLTKYDANTKAASLLTGDATVRSLRSQLRNVFNTALTTAGGGLSSLADIGVSFQTDGKLKLDTTKLDKVLADSTKDVATLFAAMGKPSDGLVSFVASTSDTKNGSYAVSVDRLATQGKAVGSVAAATTITAGANDTLTLTIDGVEATVTLAAGTYTAATLAAEIQSRINGEGAIASAGAGVTVSESSGKLTVTSSSYGSASKAAVTGGTAATDLFGTPASTDGLDASGSIGGFSATGSGQILTATGDPAGMQLKITGGATGDRGTVAFARGFAYELDKLAAKLLENDGVVDSRLDGLNASVKDIGKRREALEARMVSIEKRYRAQFTALDTMISSMTKTSAFLQQQLANLPKIGE